MKYFNSIRRDFKLNCIKKKRYDVGHDGFLDLDELKITMERLGAPQTHLGLKGMIKELDEDGDGKLSFREVRHFN